MPPKSINDLVANSCVFLTGVTGFVGKCLLARICKLEPGPAKIFVLVRKKRGEDAETRVQKIFSSPLFAGIPSHKLDRVQAVQGDVGSSEANFGLCESDLRLVVESCTHVYHVAAFISFAADLDFAIKINFLGSWAMLNLARKMKKLRAMVHVSTAYVNCALGSEFKEFHERIYTSDVDPLEFLKAVKSMSPKDIETKYSESIGSHPNTYTFTKQLTENLLAKEKADLPLSIVRPGIILNSWREPFAGWVDNVNSSACGFIAGVGKGVFCTFQGRSNMVMDVIPVDFVVSTILAAALKTENEPSRLHVFHCTSGTVNPTTWGDYCQGLVKAAREHPCENAAWYPRVKPRENRFRNDFVTLVFQILPAIFIDMFAGYKKSGHQVVDVQRRFVKGNRYTAYFAMRQWRFTRTHADQLAKMLSKEEREKHPIDPRLINWESYFKDCVVGTRTYFHKEPLETTDKAKMEMAFFRVIATLVPVLSFTVLCCCLTTLMGFQWTLAAPFAAFLILTLVWI